MYVDNRRKHQRKTGKSKTHHRKKKRVNWNNITIKKVSLQLLYVAKIEGYF